MNDMRLVCVGFKEPFEIPSEDIEAVLFFDRLPKDVELREIIFAIERIAKNADVIVVNTELEKDNLSMEEAIFVQIAYTINTPIFGVGKRKDNSFLANIALNNFDTSAEAMDYIRANYGGF